MRPRVHAIVICHMEPALIAASLAQLVRTAGKSLLHRVVMVDNRWPIKMDNASDCIGMISRMFRATVITAPKNLGGHGGANFAMDYLKATGDLEPNDLILGYDPDSFPITDGWLAAMVDVMNADPGLATVGLWPDGIRPSQHTETTAAGHRIWAFQQPEMMNVTLWRASFIGAGIEAEHVWYGQVEAPMYRRAKEQGLRMGYLPDFKEGPRPIPHPQAYTDWKAAHVSGLFPGNFSEWVGAQ